MYFYGFFETDYLSCNYYSNYAWRRYQVFCKKGVPEKF